jgi:acyl carrier protein phosphodiesterase
MNFLTTLYFAQENNEGIATGLIIGNTAKPNYLAKYNVDILKGILLETKIREFSEKHEAFVNSASRLSTKYAKHRNYVINIFFDHLLASNWQKYSNQNLEEFADKIYQLIVENMNLCPYKIRKYSPEMINKKWITGLSTLDGTHQYVNMLFKKERFSTNLEYALFELSESYNLYKEDFEKYFEALISEVKAEQEKILETDNVILVSA